MTKAHENDPTATMAAKAYGEPAFQRDPMHGFAICSYCGSVDVETAISLLATPGVHFSGSDWKYGWPHKFYLDAPNPRGGSFAIGTSSGGNQAESPGGQGWVRMADLTDEQRSIAIRDGMLSDYPLRRRSDRAPDWIRFGRRDRFNLKFYSVHLMDAAPDRVKAFSDLGGPVFGVRFEVDEKGFRWSARPDIERWGRIGGRGQPIHEDGVVNASGGANREIGS